MGEPQHGLTQRVRQQHENPMWAKCFAGHHCGGELGPCDTTTNEGSKDNLYGDPRIWKEETTKKTRHEMATNNGWTQRTRTDTNKHTAQQTTHKPQHTPRAHNTSAPPPPAEWSDPPAGTTTAITLSRRAASPLAVSARE